MNCFMRAKYICEQCGKDLKVGPSDTLYCSNHECAERDNLYITPTFKLRKAPNQGERRDLLSEARDISLRSWSRERIIDFARSVGLQINEEDTKKNMKAEIMQKLRSDKDE